jgi:hypothetical protein
MLRSGSRICGFSFPAGFGRRGSGERTRHGPAEGFEEICTFDRQQQAAVRALGLALATVQPKIFKLVHQVQEPGAQ